MAPLLAKLVQTDGLNSAQEIKWLHHFNYLDFYKFQFRINIDINNFALYLEYKGICYC